jgi:hypothetical protein
MMGASGEMKNYLHVLANRLPECGIDRASRYLDVFQPFGGNVPHRFRTIHRPDLMTRVKKSADEMSANKTICAGNEALHDISFFANNSR